VPVTLSNYALITDIELKRKLDVKSGTGADDAIKDICNGVSLQVETHLKRQIVKRTSDLVEFHTFRAYDTELLLIDWPVISITEIREDLFRSYAAAGTLLTVNTDYILQKKRARLLRVRGPSPWAWLRGFRAVRVTYQAGYADTASVPQDLKDVCLLQAAIAYSAFKRQQFDILSQTDAAGNFSRVALPDLNDRMLRMLRPFRREFPSSTGERDE